MLKKFKKTPVPVKASFWYMVANFLPSGISIISAPIFTRIMTQNDYGIVNVYNAWFGLLSIIVTISLVGGVYNNGMLDFSDDVNGFTSSLLTLSCTSTIIFYFIYLIFQQPVNLLIGLSSYLIHFMFLGFFLNSAFGFWMARQRFIYKYKLSVTISIIYAIITPIISYLAVINYPQNKAIARIIFGSMSNLIINLMFLIYIFVEGRKFIDFKYWKYALAFNLPLIPHNLSGVALSQSDRIIIAHISGTADAGVYSVAYTVASIISIIFGSINASWLPFTYKKMKEQKYSDIGKYSKPLLIFIVFCCVFLIAFTPEIIRVLAPPSYYQAIWVVPPVVLGLYYMFVYTLFANIEFYHKKNMFIMIGSVSAALLNILLNLIVIRIFGYIAAAYTTLAGYFALSFVHYLFLIRIEKNKIYDIKFFIQTSFALVAVTAVLMILFNRFIIRYSMIACALIFMLIFRKRMLFSFKELLTI